MLSFKEFITEGVYDQGIFKVIFMAGGPGSGKSFILEQFIKQGFHHLGLRIVASDIPFEYFLKKAGLTSDPETIASPEGQAIRTNIAKRVTKKQLHLLIEGRVGLVIDGTAADYAKLNSQATLFESHGYETAMVFVNTDLETSLARNASRPRSLKDEVVTTKWHEAQSNIGKYSNRFKQKFFIVDNSDGANYQHGVKSTFGQIAKWVKQPPASPEAKTWIKQQIAAKNRL